MSNTKQKRYTVELDAYLYARNDREAMVKSAKIAEFLRTLDDNQANVTKLTETPFGSCDSREVHKGTLTLFENKLIER
ncbi:hypothetical protein HYO65_gp176 [Tenacibaculum phage PTm1]|uniref:Uncharacterized protein n=2 Tax=Shirahamavirus PTm1 TaxID=2846435 RepID=A0A5S9EQT5_9CAUD|nr:hypothetical protein HYO65_gp176 [Tenacibaculum phage PTm1]BBI90568.1 hypothetical protein [Tenacibaculum phage PTm1]BBI90876.1 hypothetical protein [Tenacibaculum phage PTm5]